MKPIDLQLAYMAGFFDGEGCIGIRKPSRSPSEKRAEAQIIIDAFADRVVQRKAGVPLEMLAKRESARLRIMAMRTMGSGPDVSAPSKRMEA